MANKQAIQQCIQTCTQVASSLRTAANSVTDSRVRNMTTLGAHHIEECIRNCESASQMI